MSDATEGPRYRAGFTAEDYDRLKEAVLRLAARGAIDPSSVLVELQVLGIPVNAGTVGAMLTDLTDLGELERIGVEPQLWRLPSG